MVIWDLQDYWTLVQLHREGDETALTCLELMGYEDTKEGELARRYLLNQPAEAGSELDA